MMMPLPTSTSFLCTPHVFAESLTGNQSTVGSRLTSTSFPAKDLPVQYIVVTGIVLYLFHSSAQFPCNPNEKRLQGIDSPDLVRCYLLSVCLLPLRVLQTHRLLVNHLGWAVLVKILKLFIVRLPSSTCLLHYLRGIV